MHACVELKFLHCAANNCKVQILRIVLSGVEIDLTQSFAEKNHIGDQFEFSSRKGLSN